MGMQLIKFPSSASRTRRVHLHLMMERKLLIFRFKDLLRIVNFSWVGYYLQFVFYFAYEDDDDECKLYVMQLVAHDFLL